MKILSNNVAGLNQLHKLHAIIRKARLYDITFLQETKLKLAQRAIIRTKWGSNNIFTSCDETSRRGVVTLIHPRISPTYLDAIEDPNAQFHIVVCIIKGENYMLINTYSDPDTDAHAEATMNRILRTMDDLKRRFTIHNIVMAGDFNFVLRDDDTTSHSRKPRAEAVCNTIIHQHDLYDVAALQSLTPVHTYFRHRREGTSARYDRIYTTSTLLPGGRYRVLTRTSDHAPIEWITELEPRKSLWKFPDFLLNDGTFMEGLHNTIKETLTTFTNVTEATLENLHQQINLEDHCSMKVFSACIRKIRDYCSRFTKERRRKAKEKEEKLINELVEARTALQQDPNDEEKINTLEEAQMKLQMAQTKRSQAAMEKNLTTYYTEGERMSRYHFQRSGRGKGSRDIPKLIIQGPQGDNILEGPEVHEYMFKKYEKICNPDPTEARQTIEEFLGQDLVNTLSRCPQEHTELLTGSILPSEIRRVIQGLKQVSAPGPLGLSNNLMKEIAPYMMDILVDLGNKMLFSDQMPELEPFLFHRIVVFILKPGKPCTDPDSYRGLSMLEGFFKLYSKILAERMQRAMAEIQNPHQFGFTKGKGCLEASRTVLDVIQHANRTGQPLVVVSTDFSKAFDSISHNHIEESLRLYQFPEKFRIAFMRLARNGTMQFEINGNTSQDHQIKTGTGQGDPKSSAAYNIAAAPLNHYLAHSHEVPRYAINEIEVAPVYFADDDLLLLDGSRTEEIIQIIEKMDRFKEVSGLTLNRRKCEFLAINCRGDDIDRLENLTQMKRVQTLKHLGLMINEEGRLPRESNIDPIVDTMKGIAKTLNTVTSTPLGRALYAKYLISSKYIHRIQNYDFSHDELKTLREAVLKVTWARHRIGTDTTTRRVHIANDRVAQPLRFGGLAIPDPSIQVQALRFSWARRFKSQNNRMSWYKVLESELATINRPDLETHMKLGVEEWYISGRKLEDTSPYWSKVFNSIGKIIQLAHTHEENWHLIPITGYEGTDINDPDIGSLAYRNPRVRNMINAGLVVVGQLFPQDDLGRVTLTEMKPFDTLEQEWDITIPIIIRNSIITLTDTIRRRYLNNAHSQLQEGITTLESLLRASKQGCSKATRLVLKEERKHWQWGETPRSYHTYIRDDMIHIAPDVFMRNLANVRRNLLSPAVQWTSIQIFLRTLWTKKKESNTRRGRQQLTQPNCDNCGNAEEDTQHLMVNCPVAQAIWRRLSEAVNDCPQRSHLPNTTIDSESILFNHEAQNHQGRPDDKEQIIEALMIAKHTIIKIKHRENTNNYPTERLTCMMLILDIEKAITAKENKDGKCELLKEIQDNLGRQVGYVR